MKATGRRRGARLTVTTGRVDCAGCRATLTVRQGSRIRRLTMRRRGRAFTATLSGVRRGRVSFRVVLSTRAASAWRSLK